MQEVERLRCDVINPISTLILSIHTVKQTATRRRSTPLSAARIQGFKVHQRLVRTWVSSDVDKLETLYSQLRTEAIIHKRYRY